MRKLLYTIICCIGLTQVHAQIEISKLIGKRWQDYNVGFGGYLKFAIPVAEANYFTIETGVSFFFVKESDGDGLAIVPIKLGYRHILDNSSTGWYIEPQAGYNFFGANSYDGEHPYKGVDLALGAGYLFPPGGHIQFDIGLRYETVLISGGAANFIALRVSHSFQFGRRNR